MILAGFSTITNLVIRSLPQLISRKFTLNLYRSCVRTCCRKALNSVRSIKQIPIKEGHKSRRLVISSSQGVQHSIQESSFLQSNSKVSHLAIQMKPQEPYQICALSHGLTQWLSGDNKMEIAETEPDRQIVWTKSRISSVRLTDVQRPALRLHFMSYRINIKNKRDVGKDDLVTVMCWIRDYFARSEFDTVDENNKINRQMQARNRFNSQHPCTNLVQSLISDGWEFDWKMRIDDSQHATLLGSLGEWSSTVNHYI